MAAGFGSLRRFNDVFKTQYKLSPVALRKRAADEKKCNGDITLALGYRPPYHWEKMLNFLDGRAIAGVEVVRNGEYLRTVRLENAEGKSACGWVRVGHKPKKNTLSVTVSETLLPVLPQVLARIRHLFDLYCAPDAVYETLRVMNDIRPELCVLGTRVPGCFNAFETIVRSVLGQQITVKAASTLAARIVNAYGALVQTEIEGLTHTFPTPKDILALGAEISNRFGELGVIAARSNTIYELARSIAQGEIDVDSCAKPQEEMKKLMKIRGIGSWTAQYIAMRAMEYTDAFLEMDAGIKKALGQYTSKELLKMAEAWRPWRSYAVVNLWNTL
jgi:AraC family transcriptional regulator of adaptative response / DNA-3-methyladenine glycosylase II